MLAAIVVVASSCFVIAQDRKPLQLPSVTENAAINASSLLLEIDPHTPPFGYSEIAGPGETPKWAWISRSRIAFIRGREAPPGKPIQAVRFESVVNGEMVEVKVTVLRGEQSFEQEDPVGVYQIGIGEQKTITDLDRFAIEPFKIRVTNTVPPLAPPPSVQNQTRSVDVINIQQENVPRPAYRLTLQNFSDKRVLAVRVEVTMDGRGPGVSLFQGEEGQALLEPGAVTQKYIPAVMAVRTPAGIAPGSGATNVVSIRSVVFTDLSFEGDFSSACSMESVVMGRRLWLKQVLALLDEELAKPFGDPLETAKQFKEKLSALSFQFEESEQNNPSSVAPRCPKPAVNATKIANGMKVDLVREVERITSREPARPLNLKSWMEEKRARYSAWLARL